jgi:peptidyl-prolyl cis-trans isomerase A (cyclophilin A)
MPITRRSLVSALALAPTVARAATHPRVRLTTTVGPIIAELYEDQAPISAGAFLTAVRLRLYDAGEIFRVVRPDNDHGSPHIDVIQGQKRDNAGSLPPVPHEPTGKTGLRHRNGTLSLPRDAPGTATGTEFFICLGDQPALDQGGQRNPDGLGFAAFGRVLEGFPVVRKIWAMRTKAESPDVYTRGQILADPVLIITARIL